MSILNALKSMVTPELTSGLASHLGESNEGIGKAISGIMPTLLGGLMNSKQEDHSMLSGLLSQAGNLGGDNLVGSLLGGLTGGNSNSGISSIGTSLVSGLLGNKMGGIAETIASFAGLKNSSSSSSLMGIGGSLIASFLGKKLLGGLNFGGIIDMLKGEKAEIASAAPSGIFDKLGLGSLLGGAATMAGNVVSSVGNATGNVVSGVGNAAGNVASSVGSTAAKVGGLATGAAATAGAAFGGNDDGDNKGGGMKWLLPLLLLGLIGAGIWFFTKGCGNKDAETTPATEETTPATTDGATATDANATTTTTATTTDATATATATAAAESIKVKLKDGIEINANKGGVEDKIVAFLNDPNAKLNTEDKTADWYDFDNLNFDLGKATITKESMVQIDNLAAILKAYPTLKIKVGGYTDKKGDDAANMKLSQSRADAVFAALKAKGANAAQLTKAEGYGETLAKVDENASDEARRADRRTSVKIVAK